MDSRIDWSRNQSQAIDLLRFPLMILVIAAHMLLTPVSIYKADFPLMSGQGIYNALCIMFSSVIPHLPVPTFFIISGYLFFRNNDAWSWSTYKDKLKRRVRTLLIPYVLWNIIPVIINLVRFAVLAIGDKSADMVTGYVNSLSLWSIFVEAVRLPWPANIFGWDCYLTGPINGTLWFMQDLMVLCIISPVIRYIVKKARLWVIALFAAAYVINITIPIPGLSFRGLLFFSIGSYFAIYGKNICEFSRRYFYLLLPASLVLCALSVYFGGTKETYGLLFTSIFEITGSLSLFAVSSHLIEKKRARPNPFLIRCTFFIFVTHLINILGVGLVVQLCRDFLYKVIGTGSYLQLSITLFLTPFLTAGLCVLCYYLLERFTPNLAATLMGHRKK